MCHLLPVSTFFQPWHNYQSTPKEKNNDKYGNKNDEMMDQLFDVEALNYIVVPSFCLFLCCFLI